MRKLTIMTALVAAAAMPAAALAGDVSYSYLGAGYGALKPDNIDRLDGYHVEGSLAIHENVHLIADYIRAKDSPLTAYRARGGAGYNVPLNSQWDIVGRLGWSFTKAEIDNLGSNKDDGAFAQAGVRGMAAEGLEVSAFVTYDDIEELASADLGAVVYFMPRLGGTVGYTYSSDLQTWTVGLRYDLF